MVLITHNNFYNYIMVVIIIVVGNCMVTKILNNITEKFM